MSKPNGFILWQGPSLIDGSPIVVIATGLAKKSANEKTGAMVQTFIIRSDIHPVVAIKSGEDVSVCGQCPKRPTLFQKQFDGDKPCYVEVGKSVAGVYRCFKRGGYPTLSPSEAALALAGRKLRLGAYGNPSAAPFEVWETAASLTVGHTGYIHNWRDADPRWSALCMASVETVPDAITARKLGYRLFRVRQNSEPLLNREIACPASKEAGFKTVCFDCMACGGKTARAKVDIAIIVH